LEKGRLFSFTGLKYDKRMAAKNLVAVWAYWCYRCGYVWLPRDYDANSDNTLDREPPKSCARCKSKYWNKPRMDIEDDGSYNSITRDSAEVREIIRKQSPEERERDDKILKSLRRKIRREERKKEVAT
jgi:hypothetical protein